MVKLFNPEKYKADRSLTANFGERGDGKIYLWDEKTVFAIQVAQTTKRPLLLRGPAGSGKSSLAPFVANTLGLPFYAFSVNARTQARDMMWEFDALDRLNDANVSQVDKQAKLRVQERQNYVNPGMLWWAFDPVSAKTRGLTPFNGHTAASAKDPASIPSTAGAVVLIDEIDKADPDVPNNLLEALGSRQFTVQETGDTIHDKRSPLVIITTNEERELPRAFLRRCVVFHLKDKTQTELASIAAEHFGTDSKVLYESVASAIHDLRKEAKARGQRPPSTAEYLDAVDACLRLKISVPTSSEELAIADANGETRYQSWKHLIEMALSKQPQASAQSAEIQS